MGQLLPGSAKTTLAVRGKLQRSEPSVARLDAGSGRIRAVYAGAILSSRQCSDNGSSRLRTSAS
ncbi:MAG: hypothetical protein JWR80_8195 [Bradyrhizobium sp.]|nr:hypothetical protein [Bradyrhizobium sp.]